MSTKNYRKKNFGVKTLIGWVLIVGSLVVPFELAYVRNLEKGNMLILIMFIIFITCMLGGFLLLESRKGESEAEGH